MMTNYEIIEFVLISFLKHRGTKKLQENLGYMFMFLFLDLKALSYQTFSIFL